MRESRYHSKRLFQISSLSLLLIIYFASFVFGAETYQIDPVHSHVGFSVKHMMVANVKGTFDQFSGTIIYDDKDITKSSANVTIKTASINTKNERRDNHLKSGDFFEAEKNPEITFKSKSVKKQGNSYIMNGTLTIRGKSKDVNIPFELFGPVKDAQGNLKIGAEAELNINRHDYGVSWNKTLDAGGVVVGDDVKIELNVEASKKKE